MTEPDWNWGDTPTSNKPAHRRTTHNQQQPSPPDYYSQQSPPSFQQDFSYQPPVPNYFNDSGDQWNPPVPNQNYNMGDGYPVPNQGNQQQQFGGGFGQGYNNNGGYTQFPQQFMADPLLNTARQIGGQFAEEQKEKFSKYISSFQLKYYFAVDSSYVSRKLGIILFPFFHQDWTTKFDQSGAPMPAKNDLNAPDLYIPLMAFITYVLVAGFVLGLQKRFSPEKLGMLTTNALFYLILENILVFVTKYVLNISQSLNIWQALAYSSYKYVGMVVCLLLYLAGGTTVYYCALAYCIGTTVFFLLRSLKTFILDCTGTYSADGGRKRKLYLLLSITLLQSLIMWLLTSSVTSYMPDKYDFAKMAMSGMGLGAGKEVPIQADGEVDYEALLKMP